jgi:hypothetical protein
MPTSRSHPHQPSSISSIFHYSHSIPDPPKSCQHDDSMPLKPLIYSMTAQLKILQYNVHTTQGKVIAPLLADPRISEFSVLAIQETWQNPRVLTTHYPSTLDFISFTPHLLKPQSAFLSTSV